MTERTLIITKEGWKLIRILSSKRNCERYGISYKQPTDEQFEKEWSKISFKNGGASNKEYPISDNEFRYRPSGFGYSIDTVKKLLDEKGLTYREDSFIAEFLFA